MTRSRREVFEEFLSDLSMRLFKSSAMRALGRRREAELELMDFISRHEILSDGFKSLASQYISSEDVGPAYVLYMAGRELERAIGWPGYEGDD